VRNIGDIAKECYYLLDSILSNKKRAMTVGVIPKFISEIAINSRSSNRQQALHENSLGEIPKTKSLDICSQGMQVAGISFARNGMQGIEDFRALERLTVSVHSVKYVAKRVIVIAGDYIYWDSIVTDGCYDLVSC
jgi:hypothetical protein